MTNIPTNAMALLAGVEVTEGSDPTLTTTDAVSCGKFIPDYSTNEIDRLKVTKGIDAAKKTLGREVISFNFEVELLASGTVGTEPTWGKLLEGCGFSKATQGSAVIKNVIAGYGNTSLSDLSVASSGTFTGAIPRIYKVKSTAGGASATAKVSVTCLGDTSQDSVNEVVTTGSPINLGDEGAIITFTFASDDLTVDDAWYIYCFPPGISYKPTTYSDTFKSLHFYHYLGGLLFKGGGARGNFTLTATAGEIARLSFEFQSAFKSVTDASVPNIADDTRVPAIVEFSDMAIDFDETLVASEMSVGSGNSITERKNVNASQGVDSFRITERDNTFAIDPDATTEASFAFWDKLRASKEFPFSFKIGQVSGNIVHVFVRNAMFKALGPTERDNFLSYGIDGRCYPSPASDDNIEIFLC